MDFAACGKDGLHAVEVNRARSIRPRDLSGLRAFLSDYPMARAVLLFGGDRPEYRDRIVLLPVTDALADPTRILKVPP